jgi:hypothetical protein
MTSFKEWVKQKTEESSSSERAQLVNDWVHACLRLREQIKTWLTEEGEGRIVFGELVVERVERGLGPYSLPKLVIQVGDESAELVPLGRKVMGSVGLRGGPEYRSAGRVDLTNGTRKYMLYRTIQAGEDVWYVVDDSSEISLLTKERFLEILMDLMS